MCCLIGRIISHINCKAMTWVSSVNVWHVRLVRNWICVVQHRWNIYGGYHALVNAWGVDQSRKCYVITIHTCQSLFRVNHTQTLVRWYYSLSQFVRFKNHTQCLQSSNYYVNARIFYNLGLLIRLANRRILYYRIQKIEFGTV